MNNIIMSLGSNFNQRENISAAINMIVCVFPSASFTEAIWTEPVGIKSDKFLNCLCNVRSSQGLKDVTACLKRIENKLGRTAADSLRGTIAIDIDILQFNGTRLHEQDWQRDYVKKLIGKISF